MSHSYEFRTMKEKFTKDAALLTQPKPQKPNRRKVTGLASFLIEDIGKLGEHLSRMNDIQALKDVFQIKTIVLSFVDFFEIPFRYLRAFFKKEPLPFKFTLLGKVIYSGVMLGLLVALLAAPLATPILLVAATSLVFLRKIVTLANEAYKSITIRKTLQKTNDELNDELIHMEAIQKQALALEETETSLKDATFEALFVELKHDFEESKKKIIALKHDKAVLEEQIKNIHRLQVIDKIVAVSLAAAYVVGFSLSLVAPPLGAAIVGIAIIVGASYAGARLVPSIVALSQRLFDKIQRFRKREVNKRNDNDEETSHQASIELTDDNPHESTADIIQIMEPKTPKTIRTPEEKQAMKPSIKKNSQQEEEDEREGEGEGNEDKNEGLRNKVG